MMVLGISLAGAGGLGCRQEPASSSAVARPTAEESFDEISRVVTNALDTRSGGIPSGFVSSDEGGRSQFVVNNEVTSKLIPPAKEGDIYRGTITVTSRSYYSLLRSEGSADDKTAKKSENDFSLMDDDDSQGDGLSASDDGLISAAPSHEDKSQTSAESVYRRPDEDIRNFELAYENGRWVLKTEPDAKTEMAVKKAFDYALGKQH
jgi:hypothetical protein